MQTINIVLFIGCLYLLYDNNRLYQKAKKYEKWVLMLDNQLCKEIEYDDRT